MNIWYMLLKDFRELLLYFEFIYFRNSFCYRIKNSWSFRCKILGHVGHLGGNLTFCLPWDCWNFRIFKAFYLYWSCPAQNLSTTLWITPLKFCNLGNKSFETDFSIQIVFCQSLNLKLIFKYHTPDKVYSVPLKLCPSHVISKWVSDNKSKLFVTCQMSHYNYYCHMPCPYESHISDQNFLSHVTS